MVEDRPDDDRTDFGVIILDSEKVDDEVEGSIIKIAFVKNLIKICIHHHLAFQLELASNAVTCLTIPVDCERPQLPHNR